MTKSNLITLNPEQQTAFELFQDWTNNSTAKHILIEGTAGTGKTFTVSYCIKNLLSDGARLALCAPTHKAKMVAEDYTKAAGLNIDVFTIHSILGLGVDISDDGKRTFDKRKTDKPIDEYDLCWIDESSMIGNDLFEPLILSWPKLLFTGDRYQLLPVGCDEFPVFSYFDKQNENKAALLTPERYKGSIKDFVYDALECVKSKTAFNPSDSIAFDDQCRLSLRWFDEWKQDNKDKVVLTFRNDDVDTINDACRGFVYGYDAPDFVIGEKLLTYAPINDLEGNLMVSNGSIVEVEDFEEDYIVSYSEAFKAWRIKLKGYIQSVLMVRKFERKRWSLHLDNLKRSAINKQLRWYEYYAALDLSAQLKPLYALTIHKSQGSGWDSVYLISNFRNLRNKSLQARLFYVGASRAKQQLNVSMKL